MPPQTHPKALGCPTDPKPAPLWIPLHPNASGVPPAAPLLGCHLFWGGVSQSVLHLLGGFAVQLPVRILEDVVAPHVHGHVLLAQAFVQPLQLLAEIPAMGGRKREGKGGKKGPKNDFWVVFYLRRGLQGRRRVAPLLALDVEVEDADVVDEDGEGAVGQVGGGLPQDLVQHRAVGFCGAERGEKGVLGVVPKQPEPSFLPHISAALKASRNGRPESLRPPCNAPNLLGARQQTWA